jgi:hypothetical protein
VNSEAAAAQWIFEGRDMLVQMRKLSGTIAADLGSVHPGEVKLAGDLGALSPVDLLQLLAFTRRSGLLFATSGVRERCLLFIDGNVAWATSSVAEERVHELLCRLELAGRVAVLIGTVGPDALAALERQILRVVAGLISEERGTFALAEAPALGIPRTAALQTRQLILRSLGTGAREEEAG